MTEEDFKKKLHSENLTEEVKIELCQWYIDNYPILIQVNPFHPNREFSKLQDITIKSGGNPKYLEYAIAKLKEFFKK
jgi:hypothetical protein